MIATALALMLAVAQPDEGAIRRAVDNPARSETYRGLDANRQPAEILAFAGIRPGMQVLDVGTGGGYFTEILADAVGPDGAVVGWNGPAFAARPNVSRALGRIRERYPATTFYATPTTSICCGENRRRKNGLSWVARTRPTAIKTKPKRQRPKARSTITSATGVAVPRGARG